MLSKNKKSHSLNNSLCKPVLSSPGFRSVRRPRTLPRATLSSPQAKKPLSLLARTSATPQMTPNIFNSDREVDGWHAIHGHSSIASCTTLDEEHSPSWDAKPLPVPSLINEVCETSVSDSAQNTPPRNKAGMSRPLPGLLLQTPTCQEQATIQLEAASARSKVKQAECFLASSMAEECEVLGRLYRFQAELAAKQLDVADEEIGTVRDTIRQSGLHIVTWRPLTSVQSSSQSRLGWTAKRKLSPSR